MKNMEVLKASISLNKEKHRYSMVYPCNLVYLKHIKLYGYGMLFCMPEKF